MTGELRASISVLIADDHPLIREGVAAFLQIQPDMRVVGAASDGIEAVRLCAELQPDVVLMDIVMPGLNGIEATRQVKHVSPNTQIIVLTSFQEQEYILPIVRAGALSYLLKDTGALELATAIRKAARGEVVLSSRIAAQMMEALGGPKPPSGDLTAELSERETEVLQLIAEGESNADIAQHLFISERTVKSHVSSILGKLQLTDRTQAAVYAWRVGLTRRGHGTH